MTKTYRRIIFWSFFFLFLITAPLAILYSQGYRFDQGRGIFVHSGSITVKPVPSGVNIFLDGKLQAGNSLDIINNSITLNGLRPGNYNLRVSADGYWDWEKNLEVHSGLSTEFWNIVLSPKEPSLVEISSAGLEKYFPSPFGKKIAYFRKNNGNLEISVTDIKTNETKLVFSGAGLEFSKDEYDNLEWNYKENFMVDPVVKDGQKDYVVMDTEGSFDPVFLSRLTNLFDFNRVRWSPQEKDSLYFLAKPEKNAKDNLYKYNLSSNKLDIVTEGIAAYDLSQKTIYFVENNNILYKSGLDGKNIVQVTFSPLAPVELTNQSRLIVYDDDRETVITQNGELYVRNNAATDTIEKLSDNVKSIQFSDDGKKLLFWNNNEISVLFLREWKVQPRRSENEVEQIIRFSSAIENVFWYRDYEHIFFTNQKKVKLVELDERDHRLSYDLIENNLDSFPSSYDSGNGVFYFVKENNGQKTLLYFNFPAKTGIFGG